MQKSQNPYIFHTPKDNFILSTYIQKKEQKKILTIYLFNRQTKEMLFSKQEETMHIVSEGFKVDFNPQKLAAIIKKYFNTVVVSKQGEISLKYQIADEMVHIQFSMPVLDTSKNVVSDIRMRILEQEMETKIEKLQGKVQNLNKKIKEMQSFSMQKRQRLRISSLSQSSSLLTLGSAISYGKQDKEINQLADKVSQQQNEDAIIIEFIENQMKQRFDKIMADMNKTIAIIDQGLKQTSQKVSILEKSLKQAKIQELTQKIKKMEKNSPQRQNRNDLFMQLPESRHSSITKLLNNKAQIKNSTQKTQQIYCRFFSKLTLKNQELYSFKFKIQQGKKPLIGICSSQAFQTPYVYMNPTSLFSLIGDNSYYIASQPKEDPKYDTSLMDAKTPEVTMRVDLENWEIGWEVVWEHDKQEKHHMKSFTIPSEMKSISQLYVAVLMKSEFTNRILLSYAEY